MNYKLFLKKVFVFSLIFTVMSVMLFPANRASASISFVELKWVVLSADNVTMNVGDERHLYALTSTGNNPRFSSSDSKIVTVNSKGVIKAKKSGTVTITAKVGDAKATCKVCVNKTEITTNFTSISMENGRQCKLIVKSTTGHTPKFSMSNSAVAKVNSSGTITSNKPGTTYVNITVDDTIKKVKIVVRKPIITIYNIPEFMYRCDEQQLKVFCTSKSKVKYKSSKSSVIEVDDEGNLYAKKHGKAVITVSCDGTIQRCEIEVRQPQVDVDVDSFTIKVTGKRKINATVSSGNTPEWSSSNTMVAVVDNRGVVTAKGVGRCYIYASEDGVKTKTVVNVIANI